MIKSRRVRGARHAPRTGEEEFISDVGVLIPEDRRPRGRSRFRILYNNEILRFEVFTAVAMKNDVFWDVMPCGSCKNLRFGGT
jgi:hypothetical protein